MSEHNGTILSVDDLKTYFMTEDGVVKAVDGISFDLKKVKLWVSLVNPAAANRLPICP